VITLRLGYESSQSVLYKEIIAIYSAIYIKHINNLGGQNVEFLNIKTFCTYRKQ